MTITHKVKMDLQDAGLPQRLEMPMGDAGSRKIQLFLYANQRLWIIPEDATVVIRYKKPDGTVGEYDTLPDGSAAWSAYDNLLTLSLAPQVLTAAGIAVLYASIYLEEDLLQTFSLEILVKAPVAGMRSVTSENYTYMTNVLRGPLTAKQGQALAVGSVDDYGRVTEVAAVDAADLIKSNNAAVLTTAQNLSVEQQSRARANIDAASKAAVDFLLAKFTDVGLAMYDEKTGEKYSIYVVNGKLAMKKEG